MIHSNIRDDATDAEPGHGDKSSTNALIGLGAFMGRSGDGLALRRRGRLGETANGDAILAWSSAAELAVPDFLTDAVGVRDAPMFLEEDDGRDGGDDRGRRPADVARRARMARPMSTPCGPWPSSELGRRRCRVLEDAEARIPGDR